MPAFNSERTIRYAIESVLFQTVEAIEVLVWDDASTDQTSAVVEAIGDSRVRLFRNRKNLGPGPTRDLAIEEASGDWIAFLDADDAWVPHRLERLLEAADGSDRHVVFDDVLISHHARDGALIPWRRLHGPRGFAGRSSAVGIRDVSVETFLRSERLLIKPLFPARLFHDCGVRHSNRSFGEDAEFIFSLLAAGATLRYVPEPLYLYRVSPESVTALSSDPTAMRRCIEACRDMHTWPNSVIRAFDRKIRALEINEALYGLAGAVRQRNLGRAASLLAHDPAILRILPRRVARSLYYHMHRMVHRGKARAIVRSKD